MVELDKRAAETIDYTLNDFKNAPCEYFEFTKRSGVQCHFSNLNRTVQYECETVREFQGN